jgi:hypothetical protein
MSIFNKMKTGLNQVKDKAQQTVEVTKLSSQLSSKRREIQDHYEELGELVYRASGMSKNATTSMDEAEGQMTTLCREIAQLEDQVITLEQVLHRVKGEQLCLSCGSVVPEESRFCSRCGKAFEPETTIVEPEIKYYQTTYTAPSQSSVSEPRNSEEAATTDTVHSDAAEDTHSTASEDSNKPE